jgi:hypothetical protein
MKVAMVVLAGLCAAWAGPQARPPADARDRPLRHVARFGDALGMRADLVLRGAVASATVRFPWPRGWVAEPGNVVRLLLRQSPSLAAGRSSLSVSLNGAIAGLFPLGGGGATREVEVPLSAASLRAHNELRFDLEQRGDGPCDRALDATLWTAISRRSELRFRYRATTRPPDLAELPYPLLDDRALWRPRIAVLRPADADDAVLTALARVLAGLGREAGPREVALAVGTARQLRALAAGGANLPLPIRMVRGTPSFVRPDGTPVAPGVGVLQTAARPDGTGRAVFVAGGNDEAGLEKAVTALVERRRASPLAGSAVLVTWVRRAEETPAAPRSGRVPRDRQVVTFAELGVGDTTVRGGLSEAVVVPFALSGDEHPRATRHRIRIVYSYAPGMARDSTLEVVLNGVSIAGTRLDGSSGETRASLTLNVPGRLLRRRNELGLVFHLRPRGPERCTGFAHQHLWGTLHGDSTVDVERDRWAELPDLSLLRHDLFPYTDPPDLSGVGLVVGARAGPAAFGAFARIAFALGRETRSRRVDLAAATRARSAELARRGLIVVDDGSDIAGELDGLRRLRLANGALRRDSAGPRAGGARGPPPDGALRVRRDARGPRARRPDAHRDRPARAPARGGGGHPRESHAPAHRLRCRRADPRRRAPAVRDPLRLADALLLAGGGVRRAPHRGRVRGLPPDAGAAVAARAPGGHPAGGRLNVLTRGRRHPSRARVPHVS